MNAAERKAGVEKALQQAKGWITTGERDRPEGVPMGQKQIDDQVIPRTREAEHLLLEALSREAQVEYLRAKQALLAEYLERID